MFDRRRAQLAALILATSVLYAVMAQVVTTDLLLTAALATALFAGFLQWATAAVVSVILCCPGLRHPGKRSRGNRPASHSGASILRVERECPWRDLTVQVFFGIAANGSDCGAVVYRDYAARTWLLQFLFCGRTCPTRFPVEL